MSTTNAPPFDPLNPTAEEEADMVAGYMAAGRPGAEVCPDLASMAFAHGWRVRRNDKAGVVDDDQRELAHRRAQGFAAQYEAPNTGSTGPG